ncbi:MAG: ABC transporter ATP-binding protein [Gammaproteobacteria bacterium]|nr:ABC transporter ATP-binding protein [Gammaproteobacteria bacterium]
MSVFKVSEIMNKAAVANVNNDDEANNNVEVVERYTNQPAAIPGHIRKCIEQKCNNQLIQLYALVDLNASMKLSPSWVAVTEDYVAIAMPGINNEKISVQRLARTAIKALDEQPGLSSTVLFFLAEPDEPVLAMLRYSHRQRQAMENIKFVIQQGIAGYQAQQQDADGVYAAAIAGPVKDAQASVSSTRLAVILRLMTYLYPYRYRVAVGMLAAFIMTGLTLLSPYLTKYIIDDVYQPFSEGLISRREAIELSGVVIAVLAFVYLLREVSHWIRLRLMSIIGEHVAHDIRRELYEHLQKLSISFFSRKQTGSLISRVSHDTDRLWDFLAFGVVEVTLSIAMLIGLCAVLISLDWRLGLLITVPVPLLLVAFVIHSRSMKRYFVRAWRKWSNLTEVLTDTIPGIRVVKAFNREDREIARFNAHNTNCLHDFNQIHTMWTKFWPRIIFALHVVVITVWIFAIPRLFADGSGAQVLSIGTFMAFLLYMGMFFQPIETIGMMARMLNRATTSALRVFEILDTNPDQRSSADSIPLEPVKGRVTFENVSFAYDGVRQVLQGVSFDVKPGEMIGLVGPSGAGKTTVTNLIVNFFSRSSGRILIDGVSIDRLDIGCFRRQVGMVLQDSHLFHGTVLDNIRYGLEDASCNQIIEASRAANAHDFICRLPHGYETMVGERGHTLSGGERQRVSIARAILSNPRILILDEATSSVDTETERKIQQALEVLVKGRTVFAIAHRLSTLCKADRLFVFEEGKLIEEGSHQTLLKQKGLYYRLSSLQRELHEIYAI